MVSPHRSSVWPSCLSVISATRMAALCVRDHRRRLDAAPLLSASPRILSAPQKRRSLCASFDAPSCSTGTRRRLRRWRQHQRRYTGPSRGGTGRPSSSLRRCDTVLERAASGVASRVTSALPAVLGNLIYATSLTARSGSPCALRSPFFYTVLECFVHRP